MPTDNLLINQLEHIDKKATTSKLNTFAKKCFVKLCQSFQQGHLTVIDSQGCQSYGDVNASLKAEISILSDEFYNCLMSHGENGLAEAYIKAYWDTPDLTAVIRLGIQNIDNTNNMNRWASTLISSIYKFDHWKKRNTKEGSKKNIEAHYDLSNAFFQEFLDPTMTYSCGVFDRDNTNDMEKASIRKIDLLCQKLQLKPGDHLLEIGTGWGALSVHAATHYGCHVTTTTISNEQYDYALNLIKQKGLEGKINIVKKDYRDLTGQYNKLVSVEMIEAVGHEYMGDFFQKCSSLLTDDGLMALQAITIKDDAYDDARQHVDFIKRYIFPGSCIPSLKVMSSHIFNKTNMALRDLQDIGQDYATTLNLWHQKILENKERIKNLGFNDNFIRMWRYYLSYCEGGFIERHISNVHMVMSKPQNKDKIHYN